MSSCMQVDGRKAVILVLGSDHLTSRGGGGGVLVRLEYFFYMFSETEIFFQHHRGLEFFFSNV